MKNKKNINGQSIVLVTAFFDIGRGEIDDTKYPSYLKRTNKTYFEYFKNLAKLDNEMIIFTSKEYKDKVLEIRKDKPTKVIIFDLNKKFKKQLTTIENIQKDERFIKKVSEEMILNIEYWLPEYVLIMNLKPYFINYAIKKGLIPNDNLVAWIDFGYIRDEKTLNEVKNWNYPFDREKVHFFTIRKKYKLNKEEDVYKAIFNNKVFIIGGSIVATKEKWKSFYKLFNECQKELIKSKVVDDDQGVFMFSLFKKREMFKLNYLGKDQWFSLFKKYDVTSKVSFIEKIKDLF